MSDRSAKGCLVAVAVWCVILVVLVLAYRFLVRPQQVERLRGETGSSSQYQREIIVAADSFSGYAILRSEAVREDLRTRQVKFTVKDDRGDTAARLKALQSHEAQLAVFTIDSLLTAGAKAGDFPGSIVLVIDETRGGDAVVALQNAVPSLEALNDPAARFVLTPNSPSEFLARVVIAHFSLPNLPEKWWVEASGAADVARRFRAADPTGKQAYVLWEPYVSQALQKPGAHRLLDSSQLKGYIVDVLVAEREFLRDNPQEVRALVEAYCRAAYRFNQTPEGMVKLVGEDARQSGGEALSETQARQVVQGIQWKNTLENYAHFGLLSGIDAAGVPHLEDMVGKIIEVLVKTRAVPKDPLEGRHASLFYSQVLAELKTANFHPGRALSAISGLDGGGAAETIRADQGLGSLSPDQWTQLRPVGQLRVEPIVFRRASAALSEQSERDLQELARRLQSFPRFYLRVIGQARAEGDPDANQQLAKARAEASAQYLVAQGLAAERIRTEAVLSSVTGGEAQAVSFFVGQLPY